MEPLFSDIHQIGVVVKNLKKTIKSFTSKYGICPWNVWVFNSDMVENMEVRGKKINYSMLVATCKSGNIDWEIIEPLDDISIYAEFLREHGEGLQHVNYVARDYEKVIKYLKDNDVNIIQYGNLVGKHIYAYFDSAQDAKHIIETSTNLPGFKRRKPLFTYPKDNKIINPIFNKIEAIGILVKNIKATAAILHDKYTLGPWEFYTLKSDNMNGATEEIKVSSFNIAICKIGGAKIRLVEAKSGENIFSEHLLSFGEGIHHVWFSVKDLDIVASKVINDGRKLLQSGYFQGKKYAFFSTKEDLKFNACFYEK
jgi:hypothetical protein